MIADFAGKRAVVTGGASGIGRATAVALAHEGCDVCVTDLNETRLAETKAEIEAAGRRAVAVRADVTSEADWARVAATVVAELGGVDVLMLNAGMSILGPADLVPLELWHKQLDVNFFGVLRGVQAFVPAMRDQRSGHVVITASVAGRYAYSFNSGPYIVSKFAAYGLAENLALYLRPHGIGVTAVCPGLVVTNLGENAQFSGTDRERNQAWHHFPEWMMNPMTPEHVAPLVIDAIRTDKFLLYTHPEDEELMKKRGLDVDASIAWQIANLPSPVLD